MKWWCRNFIACLGKKCLHSRLSWLGYHPSSQTRYARSWYTWRVRTDCKESIKGGRDFGVSGRKAPPHGARKQEWCDSPRAVAKLRVAHPADRTRDRAGAQGLDSAKAGKGNSYSRDVRNEGTDAQPLGQVTRICNSAKLLFTEHIHVTRSFYMLTPSKVTTTLQEQRERITPISEVGM